MSNQIDDLVDFRQFFYKILNNWPPLLLSLIISFAIAYSYLRYSDEIFNVQTTVLISEENNLGSTSDLLFENLSSNKKSLENKELLIKSYPIVNKTLKDLRFDIGYFNDGNIKTTETYQTPVYVKCKNTKSLKNKSFKIEDIQSTWKLNQNKTDMSRLAAADAVEQTGVGSETIALAALMRAAEGSNHGHD